MGLIDILRALFGGGRNAVAETAEVFRVNAEESAAMRAHRHGRSWTQFAAEFAPQPRAVFRPGHRRAQPPAAPGDGASGCWGCSVRRWSIRSGSASAWQGLALVPEPLWWLLGAVVSFYFGARHQAKGQEFQRSIAATMAHAPQVAENIRNLHALRHDSPGAAETGRDAGDVVGHRARTRIRRWKIGVDGAAPRQCDPSGRFPLAHARSRSILSDMITELGHFALILAFLVACFQAVVPLVAAQKRWPGWMAAADPAATAQFLLTAFAFAALTWAFVTSDFSLRLVTLNSHTAKPMLYKITGTGVITRARCCCGC